MTDFARPLNTRFSLTDEQRDIVIAAAGLQGGNLKALAGAGTGKTQTSIAIADHLYRDKKRVLYLAYNRAIRDEAKPKFGRTASIYTIHGFAHQAIGARYLHRKFGSLYPSHIDALLPDSAAAIPLPRRSLVAMVLQSMTTFLYSADFAVTRSHLPHSARSLKDDQLKDAVVTMAEHCFRQVAPDAKSNLPLPHDVYLKYWHLIGAPGLEDYDLVLMDEAQDCNGVTIAALEVCPAVVWIGDSHQQIYAFRGAVDAMRKVSGPELPLTQSFRYGPAIAALANTTLARKRNPPKFQLRGLATKATSVGQFHPGERHARLYRTNVELLKDAMFFSDRGESIAIVGDQSDLQNKLDSAWRLRQGERKGIRHPLIAMFQSWSALEEYADDASDPEISQVIQVVDEYGKRMNEVIELVGRKWDEKSARVTLTTAHRAKGREWDRVVIAPDFDNILLGQRDLRPDEKDAELNLLYVAFTRAMQQLDLQSEYARRIHQTSQ